MLKDSRKSTKIKVKAIAKILDCHPKTIYKIEKKFNTNIYVKYLKFLRDNGVDINSIMDDID